MRPLLVSSLGPGAGKTAFAVAFARRLRREGLRVGYLKATPASDEGDDDAYFVKVALELPEPVPALDPTAGGAGSRESAKAALLSAFSDIEPRYDVVVVEGGNAAGETGAGLSSLEIARLLDAKVLVILRYRTDLHEDAVEPVSAFGPALLGSIINAVPRSQLGRAQDSMKPAIEGAGIPVLGIVPQDRVMLGVSVHDLAGRVEGDIVAGEKNADNLVERLMIGAVSVDGAVRYFRRHANKAVITAGDRRDVQLAALTTPTTCLVLTGCKGVDPIVLARAHEAGVPLIVTRLDTLSAVERVQEAFKASRFSQKAKVDHLERLLAKHIDLPALLHRLK